MGRPTDDPELWAAWLTKATQEVSVAGAEVPVEALLELASAVAYDVDRPMAPVTAYVAGLAAGRGADGAEATRQLIALAKQWPKATSEG